jgi:hypothetical protein
MGQPPFDRPSVELLCLTLLIHDVLNDDDEEIRHLGATIAMRVIVDDSEEAIQCYPPLTLSQMLSEQLSCQFNGYTQLGKEAICRLTGYRRRKSFTSANIQKTIDQASAEDHALFAVEKPNLFADEVREAVIWSRVLKRLSFEAIGEDCARLLTRWVTDGIQVLTDIEKSEMDGPLGWSSRPDVFSLGMRLIYGAEVIMYWDIHHKRFTELASGTRKRLREFADVGREKHVHDLWLERIEAILFNDVLERLKLVKSKLFTAAQDVV